MVLVTLSASVRDTTIDSAWNRHCGYWTANLTTAAADLPIHAMQQRLSQGDRRSRTSMMRLRETPSRVHRPVEDVWRHRAHNYRGDPARNCREYRKKQCGGGVGVKRAVLGVGVSGLAAGHRLTSLLRQNIESHPQNTALPSEIYACQNFAPRFSCNDKDTATACTLQK